MPLPSLRPALARYRNIFAAVLLGIVLITGLLLVSSRETATVSEKPLPDNLEIAENPLLQSPDSEIAGTLRLAFSTEELLGSADASTAGSLVFDRLGDGRPTLLIWSSSGILLYADGFSPISSPALSSFKDVHDVSAADFNNDGTIDLCVITGQGVTLLANRNGNSPSFEVAGYFKGRYAQALWLDYDHDNDLDLILLGARPLVLRNPGNGNFAPQPKAIPFASGRAIGGAVIHATAGSRAFDFIVSYQGRTGVLYQDQMGANYEARSLPELPSGAHQLRAGDFTGDGAPDFVYLLGRNATMVESLGLSWKASKTVPSDGGFLFTDFANLGVWDWMSGGVLLAGEDAGFSQSREMATVSATQALVAADFNQDGKLDFAGVSKDGSILRYINQTELANCWLRIRLRGVRSPRAAQGTIVSMKNGSHSQQFVYGAGPLHMGTGSSPKVDLLQLNWPDGLIQLERNLETNKAYTFEEAAPLPSSGQADAPQSHTPPSLSKP
ncbi:MAG: CRTAC1 family protein [Bryobacterales bacterium]|nr:CRTAC1 family protein [Bryobacterales bacterium]